MNLITDDIYEVTPDIFEDLDEEQRITIVTLMARAAEKAYRRGFHQAIDLTAQRDVQPNINLINWRFGTSLDLSPMPFSNQVEESIFRLINDNSDIMDIGLGIPHNEETSQERVKKSYRIHGPKEYVSISLKEKPFFYWLCLQAEEDSPMGDLARDFIDDSERPQTIESLANKVSWGGTTPTLMDAMNRYCDSDECIDTDKFVCKQILQKYLDENEEDDDESEINE